MANREKRLAWVMTWSFLLGRRRLEIRRRPRRKDHVMTHARRFSLFAITFLLLVSSVAAQKPVKEYTIEQFMNTTRLGGSSFSPDEKMILFHSNQTGIFNV